MLKKDFNLAKFKEKAIVAQPLMRQLKLSELEFCDSGNISYSGVNFPLAHSALRDLRTILGLNAALDNDLTKAFSPELRKKLANLIKVAKTSGNRDKDLQIVVNPFTRTIERILSKSVIVNVNSFFTMFERIANDSKLELKSAHVGAVGDITLSCVAKHGEFQVGKMADEVFHPGLTFSTSLNKGVSLDTYIERLVCSNGLVRKTKEQSILLGITPQENSLFFERLELLRKGNFMPLNFMDAVVRAQGVNASFGELESAAKLIKTAMRKGTHELINDYAVSRFIPYAETKKAFLDKGLETFNLNDAQKANAQTNVKVWDVINGLTDFASHDYGFDTPESNLLDMQVKAGNLLDKTAFDTQNLVSVSLA